MKNATRLLVLAAATLLIAASCGGATVTPSPTPTVTLTATPTTVPTVLTVGAIHVGSIKDAGYNQAQHEGLVAMTQKVPGIKLLEAENVPEGPDVQRVMENMIQQGATLIFPQSFGYMDFALNVAATHPEVKFEHPAGYKLADNFGTYWAASDQLTARRADERLRAPGTSPAPSTSGCCMPRSVPATGTDHMVLPVLPKTTDFVSV